MAILTVIAITGIIIVIVALSQPARKRSVAPDNNTPASRNDKRRADLASLGAALSAYQVGHRLSSGLIGPNPSEICTAATSSCRSAKLLDLGFLVTTDTGLASIPKDPVGGPGAFGSGYTVMKRPDGKLVFDAPRAEGTTISFTAK